MSKRTPLYQQHIDAGAKMVDFGGWSMPIHYGSQIEEHHAVRNKAGVFDVSHMTVADVRGADAQAFLRKLLANDVAKLAEPGRALYSCMLNADGGVVDDLIAYFMADQHYRLIVNAATRDKDLAWIDERASEFSVDISEFTGGAMLAVQGPEARDICHSILPAPLVESAESLGRFHACESEGVFVARTGYTGEDGYEILLEADQGQAIWGELLDHGVVPVGLGARDTLRLEAGMSLYGSDLDEQHTPLESGLSWTVAMQPEDREFIGRSALAGQLSNGPKRNLIGLTLEGRGVLRSHQKVFCEGICVGEITSGTYSPTLAATIALARVDNQEAGSYAVEIRDKQIPARKIDYPFFKNGRATTGI